MKSPIFICLALFLLSSSLCMSEVDFEREVRPILINHCINCHGGIKAKAGLYGMKLMKGDEDEFTGTSPQDLKIEYEPQHYVDDKIDYYQMAENDIKPGKLGAVVRVNCDTINRKKKLFRELLYLYYTICKDLNRYRPVEWPYSGYYFSHNGFQETKEVLQKFAIQKGLHKMLSILYNTGTYTMLHEFEIGYDGHDRPLPKKPQGDKPDLWIPDPEETKCPGEQEKESEEDSMELSDPKLDDLNKDL